MTMVMDDKTVMPRRDLAADVAVERAFAAATRDAGPIGDLLEALSRGRLWLPLADDGGPVTDGSAVNLPTVIYLGSEFVPAYTSADRLLGSVPRPRTPGPGHAPAHGAARRGPGRRRWPGCCPRPWASRSTQAAARACRSTRKAWRISPPPAPWTIARRGSASARRPPSPRNCSPRSASGLGQVRAAREAATAWLSVRFAARACVISVALDDPADPDAQRAVLDVVERAASAAPGQPWFPIDVTFPGEGEPDTVDQWVAASATPFYSRA